MLIFSTMLDVQPTVTKDDFIQLIIKWNQGSPHLDNRVPNLAWNGEKNIRFGNEKLWLDIEEYRNANTVAVRYEKQAEDGVVWGTDFVLNFTEYKLSIQMDRSYTREALNTDTGFKPPQVIEQLIEGGFLMPDGDLPVSYRPIMIDDDNLSLLTDVINGKKRYKLPVVYVSRNYYDEEPLNVRQLAGRLKGLAHVMVQKSSSTYTKLRKLCDGKNEYYGAVGIYYPGSALPKSRFLYRREEGVDFGLADKVFRTVVQYASAQMTELLYTWQGVNNALLRDRLSHLGEEFVKVEQNADRFVDGFLDDFDRMEKRVKELTEANEALRQENYGLRAQRRNSDRTPVLYFGYEQDLYPGEIKDLLLSELSGVLPTKKSDSRRAHIISDILENNDYQETSKKRAKEIKDLLTGYKGMSDKLTRKLEKIGLKVYSREGKHCKLHYYGDDRYQFTFAKSASDFHAGDNNAQTVINKVF